MRAKLVVQVKLRSPNKDGSLTERVCLVDNGRVRKGSRVTLVNCEDPRRKWEVVWVSEALDSANIHIDWHAGGL